MKRVRAKQVKSTSPESIDINPLGTKAWSHKPINSQITLADPEWNLNNFSDLNI